MTMEKGKGYESAREAKGSAPATTPAAAEDVPDPEEDDLDDLDGTNSRHVLCTSSSY